MELIVCYILCVRCLCFLGLSDNLNVLVGGAFVDTTRFECDQLAVLVDKISVLEGFTLIGFIHWIVSLLCSGIFILERLYCSHTLGSAFKLGNSRSLNPHLVNFFIFLFDCCKLDLAQYWIQFALVRLVRLVLTPALLFGARNILLTFLLYCCLQKFVLKTVYMVLLLAITGNFDAYFVILAGGVFLRLFVQVQKVVAIRWFFSVCLLLRFSRGFELVCRQ